VVLERPGGQKLSEMSMWNCAFPLAQYWFNVNIPFGNLTFNIAVAISVKQIYIYIYYIYNIYYIRYIIYIYILYIYIYIHKIGKSSNSIVHGFHFANAFNDQAPGPVIAALFRPGLTARYPQDSQQRCAADAGTCRRE
jgi:hypothetical protein